MKKYISGKVLAAIVAGVAVVAVVVGILVWQFAGKKESYRSIQIYELNGSTIIDRQGIGEMEAIENLYLESGDRLIVGADSYARLKLDDDKYILIEADSILTIVAEGDKENSKTYIDLEQGAVTNEIQNKLSSDSTYSISTPNSVMAVRGTVFRVEISYDSNGEIYTTVSTFEGAVGSSLILPDGTKQEEVVIVEGGWEVVIHMDDDSTEYLSEPGEMNYNELPLPVLTFVKEIAERGTELASIRLEELEELIIQIRAELETETEGSSTESIETEASEEPESEAGELEQATETGGEAETGAGSETDAGSESGAESENDIGVGTDTGAEAGTGTETGAETESGSDTGAESETGEESGSETGAETGEGAETESGNNTGAESESGEETETGEESGSETGEETGAGSETETGSEAGAETGAGSETGTENGSESELETETEASTENESETETEPIMLTVTFSYNGKTFGQQEVAYGEQAVKPTLIPASSGAWDFDFSQKITEDTVIYWK